MIKKIPLSRRIANFSLCKYLIAILIILTGGYIYSGLLESSKSSTPIKNNLNKVSSTKKPLTSSNAHPKISLPIPAHQLKKLIAENKKSKHESLESQLRSTTQMISTIDQRLDIDTNPHSKLSVASAIQTEVNVEVMRRIQNIQNYLNNYQAKR